ncbi:hypothetical protein L6452_41909 [Arctium lappa]|uniref:Uncharacterized protein n=1 Tax=Arctium lappa TaxID=4217 RepID=A0ACB8XIK9_ARCLA|nr:hypothetical protein L6452_41909 [Arctium lappa]
MDVHPLLQTLLGTTTCIDGVPPLTPRRSTSADPNIITKLPPIISRLTLISFIGIIAIWANHEASKGFSITILNDAGKLSLSRKHFSLFYESNDKATRIVLNASTFVENLLYPNNYQHFLHTKKQINGVTLRLAPNNFPTMVTVESPKPHEYIINLSPSVMENSNNNDAIVMAVLQGMARVWLWDGDGVTPAVLLNGMVEYISSLAGFKMTEFVKKSGGENNEICWKSEDPRRVAGFLRYYDQRKQVAGGGGGGGGVVIRLLNEGMRKGWNDGMVDDALGMAGSLACASYYDIEFV